MAIVEVAWAASVQADIIPAALGKRTGARESNGCCTNWEMQGMHTVELLDAALAAAAQLGIQIRQDWLDGAGGVCVLKGQTCLFLDLGQTPQEHLEQTLEALRGRAELARLALPAELIDLLVVRKSA